MSSKQAMGQNQRENQMIQWLIWVLTDKQKIFKLQPGVTLHITGIYK